jgi:hypothetical protein
MPRLNFEEYDVTTALFEVQLKPIYMKDNDGNETKLSSHLAVHDYEKSKVLCVVTKNYKLISNEEALTKGKEIFQRIFNNISHEDMLCFNITMPKTRSFCHIDLIHKNSDFDVWEGETWTPFLRITNSYNRTKLLKYELGFCRWICKNGMIFGAQSVEYSYTHNKAELESIDRFAENIGSIKKLEAQFVENLLQLKRFYVPKSLLFPLVLRVFDIEVNDVKSDKRQLKRMIEIMSHVQKLADTYVPTLGENAYSALNVLTDFATRPVGVISQANHINSFQTKSANWLQDFIEKIESRSFKFEDYLKVQIEQVKDVK